MKPQNQVTVKASDTGEVFRINRKVAERQDTLTILDDQPVKGARKGTRSKSADKHADPIAAPVADDN